MITYEFENESHRHIKRFVDGTWDGRYAPVSFLDDPEFSDYKTAYDAGLVTEPSRPLDELLAEAKVNRDWAIDEPIEVHGVLWDIDSVSRERMQIAIYAAGRSAQTTVNWVLHDNTVRESTKADLEAVLDAYAVRMQAIFTDYVIWRAGPKSTKFQP